MRSDRVTTKYQIKKVKSSWKLLLNDEPVFTGSSKESCERWFHICTRYPFGEPTDASSE